MLIFTIIMGLLVFIVLFVTISSSDEVPAILGTCLAVSLFFIWVLVFSEYKRYESYNGKDIYLVASDIVMINPKIENGTYTVGDCSIKSETGATKINAELLLKLGSKVTIVE